MQSSQAGPSGIHPVMSDLDVNIRLTPSTSGKVCSTSVHPLWSASLPLDTVEADLPQSLQDQRIVANAYHNWLNFST